jgi:hypothetical protein
MGALLTIILVGAPRPASAQGVQLFTDRGVFTTAAGSGLTSVDFDGLTDGAQSQTLAVPGALFHSLDGDTADLMVVSPDTYSFPALTSRVLLSNRNFNPMVVDFSPQAAAVGLDVLALPTGAGLVVTVEGTEGSQAFEVPLTDGGPAFIGFVAPSGGISRISIANAAGQNAYVGVDNVSFGAVPPADPLARCLDRLSAAIAEGRADGSIRTRGQELERKVATARAALAQKKGRAALAMLRSLRAQVREQRGRKMARARAEQLVGLIDQCLALMRK